MGPGAAPAAVGAPTTDINGTAHINGSLSSDQNYLDGDVNIVGNTVTQGTTSTVGWADYGPTVVTGTMDITATNPATAGTVFATHGGSSLWVAPSSAYPTGISVMQGNVALGSSGTAFQLDSSGANMTIDALQAGGITSYPSGNTNLNAGSNIQIHNYANSTGSITISGCTLVCPITVSPGTTFTPCYPIIGCISASSTSITWGANTYFSIVGTTTTSGGGVAVSLPDSRMVVAVAPGGNMSLTPGTGSPSVTVGPGTGSSTNFPCLVVAAGRTTVSGGEDLTNADTLVQGTFQAVQYASNGGTFWNSGGLNITGHIDATGEQLFKHDLNISKEILILSTPGGNITNTGAIDINTVAAIQGLAVTVGTLNITGSMDQSAVSNQITGTVLDEGSLSTRGSVSTTGLTIFQGNVLASGDLSMPNAFLDGSFSLTKGTYSSQGSTVLSGTSFASGNTTIGTKGYSVVGSITLAGTVDSSGSITVTGTAVIATAPGAWFHLSSTVQMGVGGTGSWTAQVVGNVYTQGTSFSNGTATFTGSLVAFPPSLTVHGTAWTDGNTTVVGSTVFDGATATFGVSRFPGSTLVGDFSLAAGGSVDSSGTSWVEGNVSLVGLLSVGSSTFQETGTSSIDGDLDLDGPVSFTGDAVIWTPPGGALHLNATIQMGAQSGSYVSQVVGSVLTEGTVFTNGTSSFGSGLAVFPPGLSVHGTVQAQGNVTVLGGAVYTGAVDTSGISQFPGAVLLGDFQLASPGSITVEGTNWVEGNVSLSGLLQVDTGSFSEAGSSSIVGYADMDGPVTIQGDSEIETGVGGAFHMTATIQMGVTSPGVWTSQVIGSVSTQGVIFANGTSSFNGVTAEFPPGLSVHGDVDSQGAISVDGATDFAGAVTTSGSSQFPGMSLLGTFQLSAVGGSVNATGTSHVQGNITLDGVLSVEAGAFREVGTSEITGNLTMTGTVVVNGNSKLSTTPGTLLEMSGNIYLALAAHIVGNINTTGDVTISGSAVLSPSSVNIDGAMALNGTVTSRGLISLSGVANFDGPVATQGHTQLPGLGVAGNFSLHYGDFHLDGAVSLTGSTVAQGSVVANSTGYYVVGSSRFDGETNVTGSATVQGASSTVGYVDLAGGSQFGTYMVVNGALDTGGLDLQGPVILPDTTVTFASPANISGSIWEDGLLTAQDQVSTFVGSAIINGTVTSPGSPTVNGPVVISIAGLALALDLGVPFFAMIGLLGLIGFVGVVELARRLRRRRHPLGPNQQEAVRPLRPLVALSGTFMVAGSAVGLGGALWLGQVLSSPSGVPSAGLVVTLELAAVGVCALAFLLWVVHRVQYARRVRRAPPEGPQVPASEFEESTAPELAAGNDTYVNAPGPPPWGYVPEDGVAPDPTRPYQPPQFSDYPPRPPQV